MNLALKAFRGFSRSVNLVRYTARHMTSSPSTKQETVKKFKSSFDLKTSSTVVDEFVTRPEKRSYEQILKDKAKVDKEATINVRKLNKIDKMILVKLGKYKKIEDVPDEIKYKSKASLDNEKRDVRGFMEDKGFKTFISIDYFLLVCCIFFVGVAGYFYRQKKIYEQNIAAETTSSSAD